MIEDIEDYREEQYADYSIYLGTPDVIELTKCNFCGIEVEESEIEMFLVEGAEEMQEQLYCKECIENYKEENQ